MTSLKQGRGQRKNRRKRASHHAQYVAEQIVYNARSKYLRLVGTKLNERGERIWNRDALSALYRAESLLRDAEAQSRKGKR